MMPFHRIGIGTVSGLDHYSNDLKFVQDCSAIWVHPAKQNIIQPSLKLVKVDFEPNLIHCRIRLSGFHKLHVKLDIQTSV